MAKKDAYAKARSLWQNKLLKGEITIEEYNQVDPRIRMASDRGLDSDEEYAKDQYKPRK